MLLSPTATTGHLPDGSPISNLLGNCRTVRSHSTARRAHRTGAEHRDPAGHARFTSPRLADSIGTSGAATLPVQPTRTHYNLDTTAARLSGRSPSHLSELRLFPYNRPGFTVNSTRPQPVPRAAVLLMSLACSTGPSELRITLHSSGALCLAGGPTRTA